MNIDLIPTGDNPPENINVVIEVPVGGEPVKYEFDMKSGALFDPAGWRAFNRSGLSRSRCETNLVFPPSQVQT